MGSCWPQSTTGDDYRCKPYRDIIKNQTCFLHNEMIPELCAPEGILQIDSKVLSEAEASDEEVTLGVDSYSEEDDVFHKKLTKATG